MMKCLRPFHFTRKCFAHRHFFDFDPFQKKKGTVCREKDMGGHVAQGSTAQAVQNSTELHVRLAGKK
jgi:hypothetical protein